MKLNKYFSAFLGGVALLGFSACTEEVEYTPAPMPAGDEVFFSSELPTTLSILPNETSVEVPVDRLRTDGELTVTVVASVTDADGNDVTDVFTLPESVTFADGASVAEYVVDYDFSKVVADVLYTLNLKLEGAEVSPYGFSELSLSMMYRAWTELTPYSTTEYESVMGSPWTGEPIGGIVYQSRSLTNDYEEEWVFPGPRYNNLYFDYDLYVDKRVTMEIDGETVYRVTMPLTDTHFDDDEDRIMYIDAFTWMRNYGAKDGQNLSDAEINTIMANNGFGQSYYNPETGTFNLWLVPCVKGDELARYGQSYTTLQLPGFADYSIEFAVLGNYVANGVENVVLNVTRSNDLASYAYTITAGNLTEDQIAAEAGAIIADTEATLYVEQSMNILFPFTESGAYTLVAVGYDAAGEDVCVEPFVFNANTVQAAPEWKSIGWCEYTDTFIYDLFNNDETPENEILGGETWSVEVQQHLSEPGKYRLVNPYYFWVADMMGAPNNYLDGNYYLEFDATDPAKVTIPVCELGVFLSPQEGQLMVASLDQITGGTAAGQFKNGVLTFPERGLIASLEALWAQNKLYYTNSEGFFCVDMNAGAPASVQAKKAPARTVNFNNLQVKAPAGYDLVVKRTRTLSHKDTRDFILNNRIVAPVF